MATRSQEIVKKKSRLGCVSCKRLHIKCSEDKPSCEYCIATNRICEYKPVPPIKRNSRRRNIGKIELIETIGDGILSTVNSRGNSVSPMSGEKNYHDYSTISLISNEVDDFDFFISSDVTCFDVDEFLNGDGRIMEFMPLPQRRISIAPQLSPSEEYYFDFFFQKGVVVCAVGAPAIIDMWKTSGFQVALESKLIRNSICAFSACILEKMPTMGQSEYPIESLPKRMYLHNSLITLRDKIASDKSTHNPLELILTSYLVSACSIAEYDSVPIVSRTGQADMLGIAQGHSALFQTYQYEIENSFAKVLFFQQYKGLFNQKEFRKNMFESQYEFINYLGYELTNLETDKEDIRVYREAILHFWVSCSFAKTICNNFPLLGFIYGLSNEYRRRVRQGRPFALVILAFVSAFYRQTVLRIRPKDDSWDQCLNEIVGQVPARYKDLAKDAVKMRMGLKFNDDIELFYRAPFF